MTIEHALKHNVLKPWGSQDLRPWDDTTSETEHVGEIWFERTDPSAPEPALLVKLLFTTAPLSIQVHPDDARAKRLGLANGKSEAWYILSGAPGARVALGLRRRVTAAKLSSSIVDGSISNLVEWRRVQKDDAISVPAGTIHAIGGGLVIAEIQQRSDTTFRLFDYGRARELHLEEAVAAADAGPVATQAIARRLTDRRTLLVSGPYFVLERIELPPKSKWSLYAERETWLLAIEGGARIGATRLKLGEAMFLDDDQAEIEVGSEGLRGLVAYPGAIPAPNLISRPDWNVAVPTTGADRQAPVSTMEAKT